MCCSVTLHFLWFGSVSSSWEMFYISGIENIWEYNELAFVLQTFVAFMCLCAFCRIRTDFSPNHRLPWYSAGPLQVLYNARWSIIFRSQTSVTPSMNERLTAFFFFAGSLSLSPQRLLWEQLMLLRPTNFGHLCQVLSVDVWITHRMVMSSVYLCHLCDQLIWKTLML